MLVFVVLLIILNNQSQYNTAVDNAKKEEIKRKQAIQEEELNKRAEENREKNRKARIKAEKQAEANRKAEANLFLSK